MNMLRERESTTGTETPIEAYTGMHHTDECLSPHNPYLACTIFPGGMEAVIAIHAVRDDTARKAGWAHAVNVMRRVIKQRVLNETKLGVHHQVHDPRIDVIRGISIAHNSELRDQETGVRFGPQELKQQEIDDMYTTRRGLRGKVA